MLASTIIDQLIDAMAKRGDFEVEVYNTQTGERVPVYELAYPNSGQIRFGLRPKSSNVE